MQTETPLELRHAGGDEVRDKFAAALGRAVARFYKKYYEFVVPPEEPKLTIGSLLSSLLCIPKDE